MALNVMILTVKFLFDSCFHSEVNKITTHLFFDFIYFIVYPQYKVLSKSCKDSKTTKSTFPDAESKTIKQKNLHKFK